MPSDKALKCTSPIDFVINGCDARPEDKHDALSILETALGEKK